MKFSARGLNANRRWFMKKALAAAGAAGTGARLLADDDSGELTSGDAALLRFAAAAEILESDFWLQYNELVDRFLNNIAITQIAWYPVAIPLVGWPCRFSVSVPG